MSRAKAIPLTAALLFEPVVWSIGKLTDFKENGETTGDRVVQFVMKTFGLPLEGHTIDELLQNSTKITRNIGLSFRNQRQKYCGKRRIAQTRTSKNGNWSLTPEGLQTSKHLDSCYIINNIALERYVLVTLAEISDFKSSCPVYLEDMIPSLIDFALSKEQAKALKRILDPLLFPQNPFTLAIQDTLEDLSITCVGEPAQVSKTSETRYSLTVYGLEQAVRYTEDYEAPVQNVTAQWFGENSHVLVSIQNHLRLRLPQSLRMSLIYDHMMNYIKNAIRRDAFKKYIREGRKIRPSQVAQWALRSAINELRDWAQDAHLRALRGVVTRSERKDDENQILDFAHDLNNPRIKYHTHHSVDESKESRSQFEGGDLRVELDIQETMSHISHVLEKKFGDQASIYQKAFHGLFDEKTVAQIGKDCGWSVPTTVRRLKEMRQVIQENLHLHL